MAYGGWSPYVSVAKRRAKAVKAMKKLSKEGVLVAPVEIEGRKITHTFWGKAWCDHLEKFSDYENRLPRGRTYVRNGSVCHLAISKGKIEAFVSGSELYEISIAIKSLPANKWKKIEQQCAGQIGSMLELLQGRFSDNVMKIVTDKERGLFPNPNEITLNCNCPDWAGMCKHLAAVMYGIGARLDHQPELLFLLRNIDHEALITTQLDITTTTAAAKGGRRRLATTDLSDLFGVEMDEPAKPVRKASRKKPATKRALSNAKTVKKPALKTAKKAPKKTTKKATKKSFTASAVARLRKRFGMSAAQFSTLLGVSQPTVGNWEKSSGKLNLRQRTLDALNQVVALTAEQAMRKLKRKQ